MPEKLNPAIDRVPLRQFGIREMLLLMSCVAIVLAMRNLSIRYRTEAWIAYAPIVSSVVIAIGFRIFGMRKFRTIVAGTLFALLASVAHGIEMIARSNAFAFLLGHKVDFSSDPLINGINVLVTTGEAIIATTVIVLVLSAFLRAPDNAG
jgi:hypothetical protein